MRKAACYTVLVMIAAVSAVAGAETVLGAEVIRQSFAGNTAEMVGQSSGVFVYWAPDGTQRMRGPSLGLDRGLWRITGEGEFCGKWTRLRNGAEACAPIVDLGGGMYQWGNSTFRILLGNPKDL